MYTLSFRIAVVFGVLLGVTGCNQSSASHNKLGTDQPKARLYTQEELDKLLTVGMNASEITNLFGSPSIGVRTSENSYKLVYEAPLKAWKSIDDKTSITGFDVDIRNAAVVSWSISIAGKGETLPGGVILHSVGERSFQIYLADSGLSNLVNTVVSQGSADPTGLPSTPEISFKSEVLTETISEQPPEQRITIQIDENGSSKLKELTGNNDNFGKRLIIVCDNKIIAAPVIAHIISTKQVTFKVRGTGVFK